MFYQIKKLFCIGALNKDMRSIFAEYLFRLFIVCSFPIEIVSAFC